MLSHRQFSRLRSLLSLHLASRTLGGILWGCGLSLLSGVVTPSWAQDFNDPDYWERWFPASVAYTLDPCKNLGEVNIEAGPDQDGSVICRNGHRDATIQFQDHLEASVDLITASLIIGYRTGAQIDGLSEAQVVQAAQVWNTQDGVLFLRELVRADMNQLAGAPFLSSQTLDTLTSQVMARLLPFLQSSQKLDLLLGTPTDYDIVTNNFCVPTGLTVSQIQGLASSLDTVQLYAICLHEAGLTDFLVNSFSE